MLYNTGKIFLQGEQKMNRSKRKALSSFLSFVILFSSICGIDISASAYEEIFYLVGDIDLNGKISLKDASYAQRCDLGLESPTEKQIVLGNCDGNDGITVRDAYIIQRYTLSFADDYPTNSFGYRIGDLMPYNDTTDNESNDPHKDPSSAHRGRRSAAYVKKYTVFLPLLHSIRTACRMHQAKKRCCAPGCGP